MLKDIYHRYQDEVSFYAIGVDPSESLQLLEQYKQAQGYPWPVATAPPAILPDYKIITQSTKVAIDDAGVITFRAGYGVESSDTWNQVFLQLISR